MLDSDLAALYQVQTSRLNEQVKRNAARFPDDFMFRLTDEESRNLISQFATSSWGGRRKNPLVFTEQGVAMLSSILTSDRAVQTNIQIIRTFTKLREILATNKNLTDKLDTLERTYDKHIYNIFAVIRELKKWQDSREHFEAEPKEKIGFRHD